LGVEFPPNAPILSEENAAFRFLYNAVFADERPADSAPFLVGFGDVATKINKAWTRPGSDVLLAHLANMVRGSVLLNVKGTILDSAANKTSELYIGCLALGRGWRIALDDPDKSSGGANPDVILERQGHSWSIAVKTIHGTSNQTLFENIKG